LSRSATADIFRLSLAAPLFSVLLNAAAAMSPLLKLFQRPPAPPPDDAWRFIVFTPETPLACLLAS